MGIETIKKSQRKTTLEMENLGKRSGAIDASIITRIQEIKQRISSTEEAYRTPNSLDYERKSSHHTIIKTLDAQNRERILKFVREKGQVTNKGRPIRITPDFSIETVKVRRAWSCRL